MWHGGAFGEAWVKCSKLLASLPPAPNPTAKMVFSLMSTPVAQIHLSWPRLTVTSVIDILVGGS